MKILVSPAEPPELRPPICDFEQSPMPEWVGADFLCVQQATPDRPGLVAGVQRKEFGDFVNSVKSGLLQAELQKLRHGTHFPLLLIQGRPRWLSNGAWDGHAEFTRGAFWHWLLYVQHVWGIRIMQVERLDECHAAILFFFRWAMDVHSEHVTRPGPQERAKNRHWQVHFLQGLPGVGAVQAEKILDHFKGLPVRMAAREDWLQVPGMGPARVDRILGLLASLKEAE